ncbi:ACP S-malonyltransferase [Cryobacterium psychrophilum]|uniref:[acyl-carrier-protein] S-malonyltransferase n=1 Tax=Cryobacterium psychrophilum TaxID=41988 RepID=A0A4Y8KLC9_9MICO|nr:ACP S-malonyltransferase [Cryobacterium psychrophilum]TDW28445.1 [acyl-carrier-protein] S-malonyltransferase [Cryobacterium psychrophilum]TFD75123.1 ACP S-malonyltransferase [Cryobacterium psychrophilum]
MIVVVCPGQGSQTPGFLTPWLSIPGFEADLDAMSEAVGINLLAHGTTSTADVIRDTAIAQPLIVAAGLLTLNALLADGRRERISGIAGHSVGEITAAAGAGILSSTDALRFVRERGLAMQSAAALEPTGMSAVIGADETELLALLAALDLEPANFNGAGQIVVAGALPALAALSEAPPARARVIPLQVAGAFHTRYMSPARTRLVDVAQTVQANTPTLPIWSNNDGAPITDGPRFVELLVGQVSSPVRWDLCMQSFAADGVTGIIEVAPAGALVGLAKRGLKGIPSVAIKTPDDLTAAFDLIDQQS